jgi:hypothetical protein
MEKGYIYSGYPGIFWKKDAEPRQIVYAFSKDRIAPKSLFNPANVEAHRCQKCGVAVLRYEEIEVKGKRENSATEAASSY